MNDNKIMDTKACGKDNIEFNCLSIGIHHYKKLSFYVFVSFFLSLLLVISSTTNADSFGTKVYTIKITVVKDPVKGLVFHRLPIAEEITSSISDTYVAEKIWGFMNELFQDEDSEALTAWFDNLNTKLKKSKLPIFDKSFFFSQLGNVLSNPGSPQEIELQIRLDPRIPPFQPTIEIETINYIKDDWLKKYTLGDSKPSLREQLSGSEQEIKILIKSYTYEELAIKTLVNAASLMFLEFKKYAGPNNFMNNDQRKNFKTNLKELLKLVEEQNEELFVQTNMEKSDSRVLKKLQIKNYPLVRSVQITSIPLRNVVEMEPEGKRKRTLLEDLQKKEQGLSQIHLINNLPSTSNYFPLLVKDDLDKVKESLKNSDNEESSFDDSEIFFDKKGNLIFPVRQPIRVVSLVLDVGASYAVETGLQGKLGADVYNLLNNNDELKFTFMGGKKVQSGSLSWDIPFEFKDTRLQSNLNFGGSFSNDDKVLYGENTLDNFDQQNWSANLSYQGSFDSFTYKDHLQALEGDKNKKDRFFVSTSIGLKAQGFKVNAKGTASDSVEDGNMDLFHFTIQPMYSHYFSKSESKFHLGKVELNNQFNLEQKLGLLLNDDLSTYTKVWGKAGARLYFGFKTPLDFFVDHSWTIGVASDDTPSVKLFKLGGRNSLRGLEEGELIGDSVAMARTELGVKLSFIHSLFTKSDTDNKSKESKKKSENKLPFNLDQLYLKTFFDWGIVGDNSANSRVLNDSNNRAVGYGVAVELKGVPLGAQMGNITAGYAFSPDSKSHESGTVFVEFSRELF